MSRTSLATTVRTTALTFNSTASSVRPASVPLSVAPVVLVTYTTSPTGTRALTSARVDGAEGWPDVCAEAPAAASPHARAPNTISQHLRPGCVTGGLRLRPAGGEDEISGIRMTPAPEM